MGEAKEPKKQRIWRHRIRGSEKVQVSVVTRDGKPYVEVVVNTALPSASETPLSPGTAERPASGQPHHAKRKQ